MLSEGCNFSKAWWRKNLRDICSDVKGSDESFLAAEVDFMERCHRTFGMYEVHYKGPLPDDTANSSKTNKRRWRMREKIKKFEQVQTMHALNMLNSEVGDKKLLVALESLIEKYDDQLTSKGLEPSGLVWRLRECNFERQKQAKKKSRKCKGGKGTSHEMIELAISPEERKLCCGEVLAEVRAEGKVLRDDIEQEED